MSLPLRPLRPLLRLPLHPRSLLPSIRQYATPSGPLIVPSPLQARLQARGLASPLGAGLAGDVGKAGGKGGELQRAEVTLRRFWKTVGVVEQDDGSYHIHLDHRPLKTPSGARLSIPADRKILALLIANEWENQREVLKVVGLPLTSLASRAIDGLSSPPIRAGVITELLRYLDTDTTCFPSDSPSALVRLQQTHWDPLHATLKDEHGVEIKSYETLVMSGVKFQQPEETREFFRGIVSEWDEWQLAALERATYATKSFLIGFALVTGKLTAEQAGEAGRVEVLAQIERWGEVEDTHDVDREDVRRQLGSAVCLLAKL